MVLANKLVVLANTLVVLWNVLVVLGNTLVVLADREVREPETRQHVWDRFYTTRL